MESHKASFIIGACALAFAALLGLVFTVGGDGTMKGSQVLGNTYTPCDSPSILKAFLALAEPGAVEVQPLNAQAQSDIGGLPRRA